MDNKLTVSILVPVHSNSKQEVNDFLDDISIQTFQDFDLFFVFEKHSFNYGFEKFVKKCLAEKFIKTKVNFISMTNDLGIGYALHNGVQAIQSDLIIRADIGDRLRNDRLLLIYQAFKNNSIDLVYSQACLISSSSEKVSSYSKNMEKLQQAFIFRNAICHPTVAFKRRVVTNIGSYNKKLRYCEDLDLWLRLIKAGAKFHCIDKPLVFYNVPSKTRKKENWFSNFKVRIKNLGSPNLIYSIIGIMIVGSYLMMPEKIKEKIYEFAKN